jgi:hypothetical protein
MFPVDKKGGNSSSGVTAEDRTESTKTMDKVEARFRFRHAINLI